MLSGVVTTSIQISLIFCDILVQKQLLSHFILCNSITHPVFILLLLVMVFGIETICTCCMVCVYLPVYRQ